MWDAFGHRSDLGERSMGTMRLCDASLIPPTLALVSYSWLCRQWQVLMPLKRRLYLNSAAVKNHLSYQLQPPEGAVY